MHYFVLLSKHLILNLATLKLFKILPLDMWRIRKMSYISKKINTEINENNIKRAKENAK